MLLKEKAKKVIAAFATAALAVTAVVPAGFTMPVFAAEEASGTQTWDFRKGEIVTKDCDGVSDITSGNLTIKGVSSGQYKLNGSQHGAQFVNGNTIEIKVAGPTKLTVGACQYNNQVDLTVTSTDGKYTETQKIKTTNCFDKDGSAGVYTYEGGATTLILTFTNTAYVPIITAEPIEVAKTETWNFMDGSIIPVDKKYNGGTAVTSGNLTIKPGSQNGFGHNGDNHGAVLKEGNSIEIKVAGPTKLTIGDCQYSNRSELTVKSIDGKYSETKKAKTGCYHNDNSVMEFKYVGEATTLVIDFEGSGSTYIPIIIAEPLTEDVPDDNGVKKDTVYMYNFADNSILASTVGAENPVEGSVSSKDGFLTLVGKSGRLYWHDNQHGISFGNGDVIEVKVAGDSVVTFNLCQYGADATGTLNASAPKGEFVGETSQPMMKDEADGLSTVSFEYKGVATTLSFTVKCGDGEMYMHGVNVSNMPEEVEPPVAAGNGKPDVWDFGAAVVDGANNMLTADIMNGWYGADVVKGSTGNTIGYFSTDEMFFNPGGKTNNRLRGANTAITRYDDRKVVTIDGTELSGYVYSNSSGPIVYMGIKLYKGDILTLYTGSNGGASTICVESPSGVVQTGDSNVDGVKLSFCASEYGLYKIYSKEEKLVVYRAVREHTAPTLVSGDIDTSKATGINDYKISFTNQATGEVFEAEPENGKYSIYLFDNYTYDMGLVNANGYIIDGDAVLEVKKGAGKVTENIKINAVDVVKVEGKITGLGDYLKNLKLSFENKDKIYIPELEINGDSFTAYLERGVKYAVKAEGVNDFNVVTADIQKSENGTQNIEFKAKPVYDVTVNLKGLSDSAKKAAMLEFTNINEAGYVYTFNAGDKVQLRDGQYSVKVKGTGADPVIQKLTPDLKVNSAAATIDVSFDPVEVWDFAKYNDGNPGIDPDRAHYLGLALKNANENKTYLLVNKDGEVQIPVKKGQLVTLTYCYSANFTINGKAYTTENSTGSTGKTDIVRVTAEADGYLTVSVADTTYFNSIAVTTATAYKDTVTVGKNKDYQTINEALAAVAKMDRPNNERVKIVIDPGNYEEMLVVNVPNVSLVNAAGKNSSLEIKDKGVNIGENVVRITSYYGHGYDYYSMGSDLKWNADVLAANKSNGSYTTKNPGAGTTNGSYWNSTVVVYANGFEADGIVFENSFNQYISKKESEDTVVMWASGGKGIRPTTAGDTSVQKRSFVERAGALAIVGDNSVFVNCKFIGRQDTLYGGAGIKAAFHKCDILGATDYIYGGMTAVFYKCNLVMNTDDSTSSDRAYLTAAQQTSGRGYLMYECRVTSTTPGVDTASATRSKPGYFGRPWQGETSEVVFFNTVVETTDYTDSAGKSLILPEGWLDTLGGKSSKMYEFGTKELSGEDNSASRVDWATKLTEAKIDGEDITIALFLGDDWTKQLQDKGLLTETAEEPGNVIFTDDENNKTGITVEAEKGVLPDGSKLVAEPVAGKTNNTDTFTFELSFADKDGKSVQPTKAVKVNIPVPEALKGKTPLYVYYVDKDGKYEDMNATVEGGVITFTATHFSEYVVTSVKHEEQSPGTGASPVVPVAAAAIIGAAGALILIKKKKEN